MSAVTYHTVDVDGVNVFYREGGNKSLPGLLLLHGHASGSHTFRNLIPLLSDSFHVIAPDYPGFAQSDMPSKDSYNYTFVNVAASISRLTELIGLKTFAIYVFDYGAPVGFNIAINHPDRITGIVTQSGNAYVDGLSPALDALKAYWAEPTSDEKRQGVMFILDPPMIKGSYTHSVPNPSLISPDPAALDISYISRPGALEIQLKFLLDYGTVVQAYPKWQEYLRQYKPKVVGIWGKDDPFFIPPGTEAFKRDIPEADIILVDGAHFLNEFIPDQVAAVCKKLL